MKPFNILYTTDNTYFPHMLTSLYSLLENNKENKLKIHIIYVNLDMKSQEKIAKVISLYPNADLSLFSLESIKNRIDLSSIPKWRGTDIANVRLFARNIIPDVEKLLYIDSDTVVVGSLKELFLSESKTSIKMVKELAPQEHINHLLSEYYNSGVILFDYQNWDLNNSEKAIRDTIKNPRGVYLKYPDQDILNLALKDQITTLDFSYNVNPYVFSLLKIPIYGEKKIQQYKEFYSLEEIRSAIANPYIYHNLELLTPRPWIENKVHPYNKIYDEYRTLWDDAYIKEHYTSILTMHPNFFQTYTFITSALPSSFKRELKKAYHNLKK